MAKGNVLVITGEYSSHSPCNLHRLRLMGTSVAPNLSSFLHGSMPDLSLALKDLLVQAIYSNLYPYPYESRISPQNDFLSDGNMPIPGAEEDAENIASLIDSLDISEIYISLCSRMKYQISHPSFWQDSSGNPPVPLETVITKQEVQQGRWAPVRPEHLNSCIRYLHALQLGNRAYMPSSALRIWPEHCLLGSQGHSIIPAVFEAVQRWEAKTLKAVKMLQKGKNSLTEQYSIFRPEVKVRGQNGNEGGRVLLKELRRFRRIIICGQSLSHSVRFSTHDFIEMIPRNKRSNVWLIRDASSPIPIPSLEEVAQNFLAQMQSKGVRVFDTGEAIAQLSASPSQEIHENTTFGEGAYLTFDRNRVYYQFLNGPPPYENGSEDGKELLAFFSTNLRVGASQMGRRIELESGCSKRNKAFFRAVWKFASEGKKYKGALKLNSKLQRFDMYGYIPYQSSFVRIGSPAQQGSTATDDGVMISTFSAIAVVPRGALTYKGLKTIRQEWFIFKGNQARGFANSLKTF